MRSLAGPKLPKIGQWSSRGEAVRVEQFGWSSSGGAVGVEQWGGDVEQWGGDVEQ